MKIHSYILSALVVVAVAALMLVPEGHALAGASGDLLFTAMAVPAAVQGASQMVLQPAAWQRIREQSFNFQNVGSPRATGVIPRYDRTLHSIIFELGGTSFTHAMITAIRIKLGSDTIYGPFSATQLEKMNKAMGEHYHSSFLVLDFTDKRMKNPGAELVGGWDLTTIRKDVDLYIEVESTGYTAPTLKAHLVWGQPQPRNKILKQVLGAGYALSIAGENAIYPDFKGCDVARLFTMYGSSKDWNGAGVTAATSTAWTGNTGDGAMGAITVSTARTGTHKIVALEPGSNVGTFAHFQPTIDGKGHELVSKRVVVAAAYSAGGLAFTLADGATDFASGDGFDIEVKDNLQGNVYRVALERDDKVLYDREDQVARFEQKRAGLVPISKMVITDFVQEQNHIGLIRTAGAKIIKLSLWATEADTVDIFSELYRDIEKNPF